MAYTISALVALLVASGTGAIISLVFFDDYREGFRILFHRLGSADIPDPPMPPEEPEVSGMAQFAFVGAVVLVALITFVSACYWFKRFGI